MREIKGENRRGGECNQRGVVVCMGFNPRGGRAWFGWDTDNADRKRPRADKQSVVYYSTKPLRKERRGLFRRNGWDLWGRREKY